MSELNCDRRLTNDEPHFIFLVILGLIFSIYLTLYWQYLGDVNGFVIQAIICITLFLSIYRKQIDLNLSSPIISRVIGCVIILLLLLRTKFLFLTDASSFLFYFFPIISVTGYLILIAGVKNLKRFSQELITLILLSIVIPIFNTVFTSNNPTTYHFLTVTSAKLAYLLLWYLGFDAINKGSLIYINGGAVDVLLGCTGWSLFIILIKLSLCVLLLFGSLFKKPFFLLVISFAIALILSIIRLMIMAVVVNDKPVFHYWHGYEGESIFTSIGMTLFWGIIFLKLPNSFSLGIPPIKFRSLANSWFGVLVLILAIALLNFSLGFLVSPKDRAMTAYQLPAEMPLEGWNFINSTELSLIPRKDEVIPEQRPNSDKFDIVLGSKTYHYQNDKKDLLNVKVSYLINTFGIIRNYYSHFEGFPSLKNAVEQSDQNGFYLSFVNDNQPHFTACINVKGKTTVTYYQFIPYIRQSYREISHLFNWLIGRDLLQDLRCLWLELGLNNQSEGLLQKTWFNLVSYWQQNFPSLGN